MAFQKLHKTLVVRSSIPYYRDTLVPPIFLGMPPLPLKGVNYANTLSLSGISGGGAKVINIESGTKPDIRTNKGNRGRARKTAGTNTFSTKSNNGSKKETRKTKKKRVLLKDKNGRFVKKGVK